jgi:hypothetical protein
MVTVTVPTGKSPVDFKKEIEKNQDEAKTQLLNDIIALGVNAVINDNKITITIPPTSSKSVDEVRGLIEALQTTFNSNSNNAENHIRFDSVSVAGPTADGECGVRKMRGRSPTKDGRKKRKSSPRRH